jgi:hypothetical protein
VDFGASLRNKLGIPDVGVYFNVQSIFDFPRRPSGRNWPAFANNEASAARDRMPAWRQAPEMRATTRSAEAPLSTINY